VKDAFDLWWEWAEKPFDSYQTVPVEIHSDGTIARGSTQPREGQ
jgi:hypothetical protein